jgi:hypothetical protein
MSRWSHTPTHTGDWPERRDGVTRDRRYYRSGRTNWVYHDECDDGHSAGEGHMKVHPTEGGDFEYRCCTCGFSVPYENPK